MVRRRSGYEHEAGPGDGPFISIALPVHNGDDYLEAALLSVLEQSYPHFELVVSDNASTDRTAEILAAHAARDERVVVSRTETFLMQAENVSRSVDLCRGEWVKLLCHDDLLDPHCLETLARSVEGCPPTVGLVGHGERWLFENGVVHDPGGLQRSPATCHDGISLLSGQLEGRAGPPLPSLTTGMVRAAAWRSARPFDPQFQHFDRFFWAGLICSWDYLYVPTVLSTNRIHGRQVAVSARKSLASARDHAAFWPAFLRQQSGRLQLSTRGRWRIRLKPHSMAATAVAIELIKRRPKAALSLLRQVPAAWLPIVIALTPIVWRREHARIAELRQSVPAHLVYP